MMIISQRDVRKMSPNERLIRYEQEKREMNESLLSAPPKDYVEALEALRRKWLI